MKKIPTSDIVDGMILAAPLTGPNGNVILGKGVVLQAALIPRLLSWGISLVAIESLEEAVNEAKSPESDPRVELEALFAGRLVNPAMKSIFDALLEFRSRKNGNG